ncbi:hypothetical protein BT96DRAFT_997588 [Gymnopus androsaceus JB14]|uniref:AB hydrolase-1 domain-containing protein n=1 Tax=Gymnopus androsaceus JB14 TaxID=1447944 RepID=A0A6A4HCM6_9AGAR|nr:hypothetical protein BT96DRAFT_997588 [Gymnopus androsaceus JB14]
MPIFTLPNSIEFFYIDSGLPSTPAYTTYFVVHGHSFHSGVFKRLLPVAHKNSHRMIAVNRREYAGSTPYTEAELDVFAQGSDEQRLHLLLSEGTNLALCLEGLIHSLCLQEAVREKLALSVHKIIMWEPPVHCLGVEPPPTYLPLLDLDIAPEARPLAFVRWGYSDPNRRGTFKETPFEELSRIIDLSPGDRCDTFLLGPAFAEAERIVTNRALFDISTRSAWGATDIWNLVGDASTPSILAATWFLEDQVQSQHSDIHFSVIKGVNHFQMWDDPESCMKELELCTVKVLSASASVDSAIMICDGSNRRSKRRI